MSGEALRRSRRLARRLLRRVLPGRRPRRRVPEWSIALYAGASPLRLAPLDRRNRPLLTWRAVTDARAEFVADPFLLRANDRWFLFFEIYDRDAKRGKIGVAVSRDGHRWRYGGIVLAEPFHLSYPQVFEWEGEYYMVPETGQARAVRLYRATRFPDEWVCTATLLEGESYLDPSLLHHDGRWWLFTGLGGPPYYADMLRLHFGDVLTGPWHEHPASPLVVSDSGRARPAGRPVVEGGRPFRFAQDCSVRYGASVRAFEIQELTTERYREAEVPESPILAGGGAPWSLDGMHHVDAHFLGDGRWLAAVDGHSWRERRG